MNPQTMSIAAVERETGLSKDTLRVWERRYGFPQPGRDQFGERAYPAEQVARLRSIKRLLDVGHRPSQVVKLDVQALAALSAALPASSVPSPNPTSPDEIRALFDTLRSHDVRALSRRLNQTQARLGLGRFITEVVTPLTTMVGDAWMRGQLQVYEEHAYTEALQTSLRTALSSLAEPNPMTRPRIMLATLSGEMHGLGLLMAEAILLLEGAHCTPLGTQLPLWDVVQAAHAFHSDIVVLAFTAAASASATQEALADLRAKLPEPVEIWVGGAHSVLSRKALAGVRVLNALGDLPSELRRWHLEQGRSALAAS
jgi:DNA-binding transcriptional MerR regulator/methylmalonyl-CoA mutase cobalamin-binding subunit